jgi:hypothetical protein
MLVLRDSNGDDGTLSNPYDSVKPARPAGKPSAGPVSREGSILSCADIHFQCRNKVESKPLPVNGFWHNSRPGAPPRLLLAPKKLRMSEKNVRSGTRSGLLS